MNIPNLFYSVVRRDLLKVTGRDRQTFLQGMLSNDIVRLQSGEGCYAFLLDATAHVLADVLVMNTGDYLLLDLEPGMASFVAETLEKYLIMEKARISIVDGSYGVFAVGGKGLDAGLTALAVPDPARLAGGAEGTNTHISPHILCAVVDTAGRGGMCRVYDLQTNNMYARYFENLNAAGAVAVSGEFLEARRIEAGIPRYGVDIDRSVLAPETGQRLRAISYRKGCYIGQEIVARIDARGHTNRGFAGLFLEPSSALLPEHNAPLFVDGREVGRVTSAAIAPSLELPVALGYLRNEHAVSDTQVRIGSADGAVGRVAALPFSLDRDAAL